MTESAKRAVCIGEALVELARGADGRFALASSGDTFNTAIYLARAGLSVALASALGDDPFSDAIVSTRTTKASGAFITGARRRRRANCSSCRAGAPWRRAWSRRG